MSALPPPLPRITARLVDDLRRTLGPELVAAYVYGSAIAGGFEPGASDMDVVVVTARPVEKTPIATFQGLIDRLIEAEPDWGDRLDITYIDRATLATFRSGGHLLSVSHDEQLRLYDNVDKWLETWFLVRVADSPLFGPSARDLIPQIDAGEFVAAVAAATEERVARFSAEPKSGERAYLVLTMGRTILSLDTESPCSKVEGAAAIVGRYPASAGLVTECLAVWRSRGRLAFGRRAERELPALIERLQADIRAAREESGRRT